MDDNHIFVQLTSKAISECIDSDGDTTAGAAATTREDVVSLLAEAIDNADAGVRMQLAGAIFDISAKHIWGKK